MKHDRLHSVAHNFADSMASGLGFVVGHCPTDVFADAAANGEIGVIVDFLRGRVFGKSSSYELRRALPLYCKAFPNFCEIHGANVLDFTMFRARFVWGQLHHRYLVTIEDSRGKCSTREYEGCPGRRVKQYDALTGFHRPKIMQTPDIETLKCNSWPKRIIQMRGVLKGIFKL